MYLILKKRRRAPVQLHFCGEMIGENVNLFNFGRATIKGAFLKKERKEIKKKRQTIRKKKTKKKRGRGKRQQQDIKLRRHFFDKRSRKKKKKSIANSRGENILSLIQNICCLSENGH